MYVMDNGKVMSILMLQLRNYLLDFVEIWYLFEDAHRKLWSFYIVPVMNVCYMNIKWNFIIIIGNVSSYSILVHSSKYRLTLACS
jgi:hypothetical protein